MRSKNQKSLKIGDLAKRSGLSVRALHHYDSIGLLSPSVRTDSRTRLYGEADFVRLHRIQILKQVGYSLIEIRQNLDDPDINPLDTIQRQISILRERARQAGRPTTCRAVPHNRREFLQSDPTNRVRTPNGPS